jgi:DNA-directed RNA polymerase specialized sigma24 family protein
MGKVAGKRALDESWFRRAGDRSQTGVASKDPRFSAILELPDFERFVYVLSVLEGCTDQQCASLLGVSPQQIEETRLRALQSFWKHD